MQTANILQCSPATLNFSRTAFYHAAPAVWYELSETVTSDITVSIATFKSRLKTALYNRAFLLWLWSLALEILYFCEWLDVLKPCLIIIIIDARLVFACAVPGYVLVLPAECLQYGWVTYHWQLSWILVPLDDSLVISEVYILITLLNTDVWEYICCMKERRTYRTVCLSYSRFRCLLKTFLFG